MEEEILFTLDQENIARLVLNRPEIHNALNESMLQKLIETLRALKENPLLRALIIRGNGKSFCAGADLSTMKHSDESTESKSYDEARLLSQMLYFLDMMPVPTIVYVHGAVMGGGMGFLTASDIVIAESETIFGFPETKLGLIPAVIAPYVLRATGLRYVRRYLLTGEVFNASIAQHIGLIHETVESANADQKIDKLIGQILTSGPQAVREAKRFIYQLTGDISEKIRLSTIESTTRVRRTEEAQEGVKAFLNKKRPTWVPESFRDD